MKRLLPIIPIILLFLVNSCSETYPPGFLQTAVVIATQNAASWTPTPTPLPNPDIPNLIKNLNDDLSTTNPLGWIMDTQYYVIDVTFRNESERIARMDVECICMNSTDCCIPERTFLVIVESMKRIHGKITLQMFDGVGDVIVVCYDHQSKEQIGAISAPWQDIQNYFGDTAYGIHLGIKAVRTKVP